MVREGEDATVFVVLGMMPEAVSAAITLEREGTSVEIIDPRTLAPLDRDTLPASAQDGKAGDGGGRLPDLRRRSVDRGHSHRRDLERTGGAGQKSSGQRPTRAFLARARDRLRAGLRGHSRRGAGDHVIQVKGS
ncbi:MAG: transketolase C-terminal domain-containing protein [Actinomycetota bacterium]|nr:transketolase C-terminal domain-containing protein [Actinomycetota bacterium]